MNNKGLVSVIMNCHNGATFLKEAIQSILNQKYKRWELIFGIIIQQIIVLKYSKILKIKD